MDPKICINPGRTDHDLSENFSTEVGAWLPAKVLDLLRDYFVIRRAFFEYGIGNGSLSDFSYLITPAFKALEGTLLHIAQNLQFDVEKYRFRVGWIFRQEELDRFYSDVLVRLGELSREERLEIETWLNNARQILQHLRHTPAHFLAEPQHPYARAFQTGNAIVFSINEMIRSLLASGIFHKVQLDHIIKTSTTLKS